MIIQEFLIYWIQRFLVYKINRLSSHHVKDPEELSRLTACARNRVFADEKELFGFAKRVRNIGLTGINLYSVPLKRLYRFILDQNLPSMTLVDDELVARRETTALRSGLFSTISTKRT